MVTRAARRPCAGVAARPMIGGGQADDDDGELAAGDERGPGAQPASAARAVSAGGIPAGGRPGGRREGCERDSGGQHRQQVTRTDGQAEGQEEHGGEQVAQLAEHDACPVGGGSGQSRSDQAEGRQQEDPRRSRRRFRRSRGRPEPGPGHRRPEPGQPPGTEARARARRVRATVSSTLRTVRMIPSSSSRATDARTAQPWMMR